MSGELAVRGFVRLPGPASACFPVATSGPYPLNRAVERSLDTPLAVFSEQCPPGGLIDSRKLFSTLSWADCSAPRNPGRRKTRAYNERTGPGVGSQGWPMVRFLQSSNRSATRLFSYRGAWYER